jgi:UTP--glucose-1-phosphate uridylyltransferase
VGVQTVSPRHREVQAVKVTPLGGRVYDMADVVEKPRPEEVYSLYAILGRYVLTSAIFGILQNQKPGYGGEVQLTDGLKTLCHQERMVAVDFEGKRFDTGNLCGFLEATLAFALDHPETGPWLREYLKTL